MNNYYKNRRSIEVKVALFFIIGLFILFAGVIFLKDIYYKGNRAEVTIKFPSTEGIDPGDKVKLNGIAIGKTTELSLLEDGVLVKALIEIPDFNLGEDSYFIASESSLMGGHHIEIIPGKSKKKIDFTKIQEGHAGSSIYGMLDEAKVLIKDLTIFVRNLNSNLDIIDSTKVLLSNSDKTITKLNSILAENKADIEDIISNLKASTTALTSLLTDNKAYIDTSLINLPKTIKNLDNNLNELKNFSMKLNSILDSYQNSDNTVKKLIEDRDLYDKLNQTIDEADNLLKDIKENPKKYIDLKIF